jgi:hypothetical protein
MDTARAAEGARIVADTNATAATPAAPRADDGAPADDGTPVEEVVPANDDTSPHGTRPADFDFDLEGDEPEAVEVMDVEAGEEDVHMDSGQEEDTRMCELCNTRQPISATTLVRRDHANQPMNGYGCRDSASCKVRAVPAARVVRPPVQFRN